MLRINSVSTTGGERLELEGRLTAAFVPELERAVASARERSLRVALDLSELIFLDADGARCLRELRGPDLELHGGSLFVAELLGLGTAAGSVSGERSRGGPCWK
jgi:anti-anti-sigma regulatory factor